MNPLHMKPRHTRPAWDLPSGTPLREQYPVLPVGVIIPTLNAMAYLPAHLETVSEWVSQVEELTVVDSFSDDGTFEFLSRNLTGPSTRILRRPRGLYDSWNFGIGHIHAKYTYVSTVGDVITLEGLQHLVDVAEKFQAEVVVSPPRSVSHDSQPVTKIRWPVEDIIEWLAITAPAAISSVHAFLASAMPMREGILGSSASNLYRTDLLKRCPFPTDCGHAGDTAWSLKYGLNARFAVTPSAVAKFLIHPKNIPGGNAERVRYFEMFFDIALEACRTSGPLELLPLLTALRARTADLRDAQRVYDFWRKHRFPWILNPRAWQLRARRNQRRAAVATMKSEIRSKFGLHPKVTH